MDGSGYPHDINRCVSAELYVFMDWCWIPSVASWLAYRQRTGSEIGDVGDMLSDLQNLSMSS